MRAPKLDTIIIGVVMLCIALWMLSKCNNRRSEYQNRTARQDQQDEPEDRPVRRDTVRVPTPTPTLQPTAQPTPQPTTTTPVAAPAPVAPAPTTITRTPVKGTEQAPVTQSTPKPAPAAKPSGTTLFVTIDGLKVRKEPGLKSATVAKLDLYEKVQFLNERTEWTQKVNLGKEEVTDCWVKIKTSEGKVGWVFGAGVNYYKEKRKGVLEE
jgi:cytoskeletal protein RodZ